MLRTTYRIIYALTTGFLSFWIASPIINDGFSISLIDDLAISFVWALGIFLMFKNKNGQLGLFLASAPILFILISALL